MFFFLWKEVFKSWLQFRKRRFFFQNAQTCSHLQQLTKNHFHGRIRTFYLQLLRFLDPSLSLSFPLSLLFISHPTFSFYRAPFSCPITSSLSSLFIHLQLVGGGFIPSLLITKLICNLLVDLITLFICSLSLFPLPPLQIPFIT